MTRWGVAGVLLLSALAPAHAQFLESFDTPRLEARELEPCGYLEFAAPAYAAACAWYAAVRWTGLETTLGASILGRARKPLSPGPQ